MKKVDPTQKIALRDHILPASTRGASSLESVFSKLRRLEGIAMGAYGLEGGEAYLQREREEFGDGRERIAGLDVNVF